MLHCSQCDAPVMRKMKEEDEAVLVPRRIEIWSVSSASAKPANRPSSSGRASTIDGRAPITFIGI